jgi:transcription termination/antitermination protein NusG
MSEKYWFVFYTRSRQEKKVRDLLAKAGFEVFLPLQTVVKQWSDRKKKVQVPLFSSYIFVFDHEHAINEIVKIPGIAWAVRSHDKPATLRPSDLELIQRFLESGFTLETRNIAHLESGDRAMVTQGPLAGISGTIQGGLNAGVFSVLLESIDQVIQVQVPSFLLKKI